MIKIVLVPFALASYVVIGLPRAWFRAHQNLS